MQYLMGHALQLSKTPCFCDSMSFFFFFLCACSVDKERGERDVHGDQTLCVREPHPPGELRERTGRGGLESWTGEGHPSHFFQ